MNRNHRPLRLNAHHIKTKPTHDTALNEHSSETNNGATVESTVMNDECGDHKKLPTNRDSHKFVAEDLEHKIAATTNMSVFRFAARFFINTPRRCQQRQQCEPTDSCLGSWLLGASGGAKQ
jgi:hypothetical protein